MSFTTVRLWLLFSQTSCSETLCSVIKYKQVHIVIRLLCDVISVILLIASQDKVFFFCFFLLHSLFRGSTSCFICRFFRCLINLKTHKLISFTGLCRFVFNNPEIPAATPLHQRSPQHFFLYFMHSYLACSPATVPVFQFSYQHYNSRCFSTTLRGFSFPYQLKYLFCSPSFCCEITQQDEQFHIISVIRRTEQARSFSLHSAVYTKLPFLFFFFDAAFM